MAMVRFATICDICRRRSPEYTAWPTCRECLRDICPDCDHGPEVRSEDERNRTTCKECPND